VTCAGSEILEQVEVWSAFVINPHQFAVEHGAGRHIAECFYDVIEFIVEQIFRAGVKIDPVGFNCNRSVAIDFYFPYPIGRVR
jgi:hypothetical protein